MNHVPKIVAVRVNAGRKILGSFIDAEWVLHYIEAGKWSFRLDGARHEVGAGDMVLLSPYLLHIVRPQSGGRLVQYVIHFQLPLASGRGAPQVVRLPVSARGEMKALFRRLAAEAGGTLPHRQAIMGGLVAVMLGIHFRHAAGKEAPKADPLPGWPQVEAVIQCLHRRHAERDLSLGGVAVAVGLSPNYLCRLFKAATGHSVMAYLRLFRLEKAEELLLRSRLNCTEIAEAVGFSGIHLFSRAFSQRRGVSPTRFRSCHSALSSEGDSGARRRS